MTAVRFNGSVSDFVRSYREETGMTQNDLAKVMKVHPQYVSNVERGIHKGAVTFCAMLIPHLDDTKTKVLVDLMQEEIHQKVFSKVSAVVDKSKKRLRKTKKIKEKG